MSAFRVLVCFLSLALLLTAAGPLAAVDGTVVPQVLEIPLFEGFDEFGNQFEIIQGFEDANGHKSMTMGIYDTGASLVTFSNDDQNGFFADQGFQKIPTTNVVASADAVGGTITGLVSEKGRVYAGGSSALTFNFDFNNLNNPLGLSYDLSKTVHVDQVRTFVGTTEGSPNLPSIVGTPINMKSPTNPGGVATVLLQNGYTINLADIDPTFSDLAFPMPDVKFVPSGTNALTPTDKTYQQVTIPLSILGEDTTANPGNQVSVAGNPVQHHTAVSYKSSAPGSSSITAADKTFLFDTGAQLTIISPAIAAQFGLTDLNGNPLVQPFDTIAVQGAGDAVPGLPGYMLESLTLPRSDGGLVKFTDVPVYVYDLGFGIDGILGMNLFNAADSFMYDPYNTNGAQLNVLFMNDRTLESVTTESDSFAEANALDALILSLLGSRYAIANPLLPGLIQDVPEPSTWCLCLIGLALFALQLRRKKAAALRLGAA